MDGGGDPAAVEVRRRPLANRATTATMRPQKNGRPGQGRGGSGTLARPSRSRHVPRGFGQVIVRLGFCSLVRKRTARKYDPGRFRRPGTLIVHLYDLMLLAIHRHQQCYLPGPFIGCLAIFLFFWSKSALRPN
jgi:hypothetical protein